MGVIGERFRNCSFESYIPEDDRQTLALGAMRERPAGNFYLAGGYRRGKTHLMVAQYRTIVESGQSCLFVTMSELLYELRRKETDPDYFSVVADRVKYAEGFHLFIDDLDKFKPTDFRDQALYNLIDTIYRRKLGLTVTTNLSLGMMAESERLDPAIIRRIDDMCEVIEL